jgi:putative SOS response-associated peptidase YedK
MCGRIALYTEPDRVARVLEAQLALDLDRWHPSWNVGPTRSLLGVAEVDGSRELAAYRWGLVPGWAKDPAAVTSTFNARSETVATKPMFRAAFRRWRILVPVDGFYEWRAGTPKQPFFFHRADGEPVVMAGLRERWTGPDGTELRTATVLTTGAGPDMPIHSRQPVVLERDVWDLWLDPTVTDRDELEPLLVATTAGTLVHHPVGRAVGNVRNDGPELVDVVAAD